MFLRGNSTNVYIFLSVFLVRKLFDRLDHPTRIIEYHIKKNIIPKNFTLSSIVISFKYICQDLTHSFFMNINISRARFSSSG
jgi:hypothetical protein